MTADATSSSSAEHDPWRNVRPEDLPPVEPPSAGFIVQLFVVPLLIVAVVIGVYMLFGQLATAEQDWRQLVTDVKSENPHVKWRGALGLAQMLDTDARRGEAGQNLAANRDIATALSELYDKLISVGAPNAEEMQQIEFLSKALGQLNVPDVVLPVLRKGMQTERDPDIRKHSLTGIAYVAGRAFERQRPLEDDNLVNELLETSRDDVPLYRHQSAFILGLMSDAAATVRLRELLDDGDRMVRLNAAIGLSRSGSEAGVPVFSELFQEAKAWKLDPEAVQTAEAGEDYFEQMLMLKNSFQAITNLSDKLDAADRTNLSQQVDELTQTISEPGLRREAQLAVQALARATPAGE